MVTGTPLRIEEHIGRAEVHGDVGRQLHQTGNEWAAVPLFYAAYHVVRAALLEDPIWRSPARLSAKDPNLIPDDRTTERHHARKGAGASVKQWGVNELVFVLYRPVVREYERLHQASISVRYGAGLPSGGLNLLPDYLKKIEDAYAVNTLRA